MPLQTIVLVTEYQDNASFHKPSFGTWICLIVICSIVLGVVALSRFLARRSAPPPALPLPGLQPRRAPAHYIVHGVDKTTRADKTWRTIADSEANARVKAELEGMVVTGVEFERYV